jgi:hypothetical protein
MSGPLILFVMLIYAVIGIDQFRKGDMGMAITWWGYALANVGLYVAQR